MSVEAQEFITKLSQILAFQEESMEGNLEIELRFGIIDETRFQPGIKKEVSRIYYTHQGEKLTHSFRNLGRYINISKRSKHITASTSRLFL